MYDYQKIHRAALANHFRDIGLMSGSKYIVYKYLQAGDGTLYELSTPISALELEQAVVAGNCLFVKTPTDPNNPMDETNFYSTARLIEYGDETSWVAARAFGGPSKTYDGPWIRTQNATYKLVQAAE